MAQPPRANCTREAGWSCGPWRLAAACLGMFVRCACLAALLLALGCSELTARNITSLVFDGVPAPPPPDTYCAPWLAAKQAPLSSSRSSATPAAPKGSVHLPYQEKRCDDCHDKTKEEGLVAPRGKLCFICHDSIIKGAFVHGPAGTGDCLACHQPHDSTLPRLLSKEPSKLCVHCHQEARVSPKIHDKSAELKIPCYDCHNPHVGSNRYFFK